MSVRPMTELILDGMTVTLSCDVGYKLTTHYLATCLVSSSYDVEDPSCIPITKG